MNKALPLVVAGGMALGVPACGGSDSDDVRSSLEDYNRAVANKDAGKACALLSDAAKKTIGGSCEATLEAGFRLVQPKLLAAFKGTEIKDIKINGNKATATITFPKESRVRAQTQTLVKENGEWHLQAAGAK